MIMSYRHALYCVLLLVTNIIISSSENTVKVYNSCSTLEDGEYYFKLTTDNNDGTIIKAKCSNYQLIIDYNLDNNVEEYFTSWQQWHYAIAGPINGNQVNWKNWFIPASKTTESTFKVSPDCNVCDDNTNPITENDNDVAYYMTGNMFGCFWYVRGVPICDFDFDTYECRCCNLDDNLLFHINEDVKDFYDDLLFTDNCFTSGACPTYVRSSTATVLPDHDACAQASKNSFKPSLGIDGRYCVCYNDNSESSTFVEVNESDLPSIASISNEEVIVGSIDDSYELYQKDFTLGTYRITKSGTYKIMEDIIFDFNRPSEFVEGTSSANGISTWAWWPNPETQSDIYEGAGEYHGPYFLGFFAGITIEVENVVLDLNDHELKMSSEFYSQQRYFSLIELASQPFMPSQGPGAFGAQPKSANNVKIQDGKLGLTSHHGIHGNRAQNIYIENIQVYDFDTHGIQVNGFENLYINNVEIGPMHEKIGLNHNYLYGRMLLPRMQHIADTNPTGIISFANREDKEWTMQDLIDELVTQLDMAFNYANYGIEPNVKTDRLLRESWQSTQKLFINQNGGYFYGSSVYGLFINMYGSSVFGFHLNNRYSKNAVVQNVKVHGLYHKANEFVRMHVMTTAFDNSQSNLNVYQNALNGIFDIRDVFDDPSKWKSSTYTGTLMTDIAVAMNQLILSQEEDPDNWGILQLHDTDKNQFDAFAMGIDKYIDIESIAIGCNSDIMLHTLKGIFGIRIDGVETVELNNIEIYDLESFSDVGDETYCGDYTIGLPGGGHFTQRTPFLVGYSGNQVQGISFDSVTNVKLSNINVHDLTSHTGLTFGISFFLANSVEEMSNIKIYNLNAGIDVEENTYTYTDSPNRAPEACGIRLAEIPIGDSNADNDATIISNSDDATIYISCIKGHVTCNNKGSVSMIGNIYENSECTDEIIENSYNEIISNVDANRVFTNYKSIIEDSDVTAVETADDGSKIKDQKMNNAIKEDVFFISKPNNIANINNYNNTQLYLSIAALLLIVISIIYYIFNQYYKNNSNKMINKKEYISKNSTRYGAIIDNDDDDDHDGYENQRVAL